MLLGPKSSKSEPSVLELMQAVHGSVDTENSRAKDDTQNNKVYSHL